MRLARVGALALLAAVGLVPAAAGAGTAPAPSGRVLVISVPGLRWSDLDRPELETLRGLADRSAVANLATRVTGPMARAGEAYLTLGAGTRAVAPDQLSGQVYAATERYGVGTAAEEHARQQGTTVGDDELVVASWPLLVQENADAEFDATLGALGDALAAAGVDRGVVGNADADDPLAPGAPDRQRDVALVLADATGRVPCGDVSANLLEREPNAPFGVRLVRERVVAAAEACGTDRSVVVVEAGDLRRAAAYASHAAPEMAEAAWTDAFEATDALVADLLDGVDPARDSVVLVAPTTRPERGLGVVAVWGPSMDPGLLTSGNTRQPGYLLLADLTPTLAHLVGADLDEAAIEGRVAESDDDGRTPAARRRHLVGQEAAATFRDARLGTVVLRYAGLVGLLALVAAWTIIGRERRLDGWLQAVALALAAFPAWTYLAGLVAFHDRGPAAYWLFLIGGSGLTAGLVRLVARDRLSGLVAVYAGLVAVVSVSVVVLGSRLQMSTVFGDSPIVAGRFSGINNVTFALFLGAGTVLAAALVQRYDAPIGPRLMVGLLALLLLIDVAPMWGADVGGALAGVPALAVLAVGLGRWRMRWRTVGLVAVATVVLVVALGLLDLTRASADRSHLGRLFERIGSDGGAGLTSVVERKMSANLRSLTGSEWRFAFAPLVAAAALVAWRGRARARAVATRFPVVRAAVPGVAALGILGYAANDSGLAVPAALLTFLTPALVHVACRVGEEEAA